MVPKITVVLPVRNEYPQLIWTIYSFINDIPHNTPWEIIVVSNGASQETVDSDKWLSGCKWRRGKLTVIQEKQALHPLKAIERGLQEATGDVVVHGCGHMVVQRGTIPKMVALAWNKHAYVHSPMLYLGDLTDEANKWKLYGYKDPLKRGWSFQRHGDKPYKWHGSGGGLSCFRLDDWRDIGGVQDVPFRQGIGGGETLLDMKYWMFNKSVWIHPDCLYYHYARKRGYTWKMHEFYWNQFVALYVLTGSREALEAMNQSVSYPQDAAVLDEVESTCKKARRFVERNAAFTMEEVLERKPWLSTLQVQVAT